MAAPNLGTWAPPTPEYLTAPGYETYAPTAAYAYSPIGGIWSDAYPNYGGGGGLPSGDFAGGTDTSTLGGLLSAASLLGGANNLSSFLTGQSLLEHAGVDPSNWNWDALNPSSNVPTSDFFSTSFGPSDMSPQLIEAYQSGAIPEMAGGAFGEGIAPVVGSGLLSSAAVRALASLPPAAAAAGAAPLTMPALPLTDIAAMQLLPTELGLGIPKIPYNPYAQHLPTWTPAPPPPLAPLPPAPPAAPVNPATQFGTDIADTIAQQVAANAAAANAALFSSGPVAAAATAEAALAAPLGFDLFGGLGVPSTATFAAPPALTAAPAAAAAATAPAAAAAFAPALGANVYGALGGVAPSLGGAGASTATGMAALAGPLTIAGLGLMAKAHFDAKKDPTADTRTLHALENLAQKSGVNSLEGSIYGDPTLLGILETIARGGGAPFGTAATSGGTEFINWSPKLTADLVAALPRLTSAARAGEAAPRGYEAEGHMAPPPYAGWNEATQSPNPTPTFNYLNDPFGRHEAQALRAAQGFIDGPESNIMPGSYVPSSRVFTDPHAYGGDLFMDGQG